MRILHVNKFLYRRGGAEAYALDIGDLQRARGHHVDYWGMDHPENVTMGLADTFAPHRQFEPPPDRVADKFAALGAMIYNVDAARGIGRALERFRPDVAHLHNVYHQLSPSILRPLARAGVPVVMTLHDYKLACPTYSMLDGAGRVCDSCITGGPWNAARKRCGGSLAAGSAAALESSIHRVTRAYGSVAAFLCPSQFLADVMRRAGVYPDRIHVLNNYVDAQSLSAATPVSGDRPGRRAVFIGRLSYEKGVDVLVRAAALLPADIDVEVAGAGPDEQSLRQLADDVAPGRVHFLGRLSREEVGELLGKASVAVVPSRWYENQPISVLEAFASGVPVVATAYGGLSELIDDGRTGRLVPPEDPAALAQAVAAITGDPTIRAAMGAATREDALSRFSPQRHLDALDVHYGRVVARVRRP